MSIWHVRLLEVVEELGGGTMTDIRRRFVEKYGESFANHDISIVNGTTFWYRKVQWARNDLVKEGKLVQKGDWIDFPKKDRSPFFYDVFYPMPTMTFPMATVVYVILLFFFFTLYILNGGMNW